MKQLAADTEKHLQQVGDVRDALEYLKNRDRKAFAQTLKETTNGRSDTEAPCLPTDHLSKKQSQKATGADEAGAAQADSNLQQAGDVRAALEYLKIEIAKHEHKGKK